MNLQVEHGIIALLLIAFLYYFFTHQSLLSDLSRVPDKGNAELKDVKDKHTNTGCDEWNDPCFKTSAYTCCTGVCRTTDDYGNIVDKDDHNRGYCTDSATHHGSDGR